MRLFLFLILFSCLVSLPTAEALSLNPLNWFSGDRSDEEAEDDFEFINVATAADEAAANELLARAMVRYEAGKLSAANRLFKKIGKKYPLSTAAGQAHFFRGRIFMTKERWKKAFNSFQRVVVGSPNFEDFDSVIVSQFDCATALMEGARAKILWVIPGFRQYTEAIYQFEVIVNNAPYSDYAPLALMNVALISQDLGKEEIAINALDRLINFYPQSMLASDAYYNLAQTYSSLVRGLEYDHGSTRQAISYYEDFLILFPDSEYLGEVEANLESMENLLASSRLTIGDFYYLYRSNNTAALIFYNETITIAPESEAAEEARGRIADIEAGVRPTTGSSLARRLLFVK
ncbi:MAG: outer membrane protein assembly factor BamD [Verrucomicrobiota bacterium]